MVSNKVEENDTNYPGMKKKSSTAVNLFAKNMQNYNRSSSNKSNYVMKDLQRQIAVNQNMRALAEAEI